MKRPTYAWCFKSSSGPKLYQTIRYSDNSLSCDCMGWTRRVARDGSRSCKHTRSVLLKTASYEAVREGPLNGSKDLPDNFPLESKPTTTNAPLKRKLAI